MRAALRWFALFVLGAPAAANGLDYRVRVDAEAGRLHVAACTATPRAELVLVGSGGGHLHDARVGDRATTRAPGRLIARDLRAGDCLRYTVDAARAAADAAMARPRSTAAGGIWRLPPSQWLWREPGDAAPITLEVALPADWDVSLPWPTDGAQGSRKRYRITGRSDDGPAWSAFGRFHETTVLRKGGRLRVAVLDDDPQRAARLRRWIEDVADTALTLHGALPRPDLQVLVQPVAAAGEPVPWGQTTRGAMPALHLFVRADATLAELRADWTATHEIAHMFHPYLGARGAWLAEGLASYYQNVLRARSGALTAAQGWERLLAGFGRGRRERRSDGMTLAQAALAMHARRAYMRVYWSGAAYWLEADLALRARGDSLDGVLARYGACCLLRDEMLSPEAFVAALDRVADRALFVPLYTRYAALRAFPDLAEAYAALGYDAAERRMPDAGPAAAIMRP